MTERQQCKHVSADGRRCRSMIGINPETGMCFVHDPARAEEREAARRRGGQATARKRRARDRDKAEAQFGPADTENIPPPPDSLADAKAYLSWIIDTATRGEIGSARARDIATVLREFRSTVNAADLENRLAEMAEQVEKLKKGKGR